MKKKILIAMLLMTLIVGCNPGVSPKSCVVVKAEGCLWDDLLELGHVVGYVNNQCAQKLRYVKIQATGYSSTKMLLDRDSEIVFDIYPKQNGYFDALLHPSIGVVTNCTVEVLEAEY